MRRFFECYIPYVSSMAKRFEDILIDSTGLPNSIRFPLTAVSNHNGDISNEVRLIYVTQQETGLPIYFRHVPGNVVDVSTSTRTISKLKASGINTKFAILDAGYYGDGNIRSLYDAKVSFVSRLGENRDVYKKLMAAHFAGIQQEKHLVEYNGRYAYVKCVPCPLAGDRPGRAYICLDIERKGSEARALFKRAKVQGLDKSEVYKLMARQGAFILVSSRRIAVDKILPAYYTRQQIEQIFDIGKNYADMLPLRVQTEETFRGHLLLTFIASVIVKRIQEKAKNTRYSPMSIFLNLRNQKCKVFADKLIVQEAYKKANDCYRLFGIDCPVEIPISCG